MSTSLLYHAFGATHYNYLKTEYEGGQIRLHLAKKPGKQRCVVCRSNRIIRQGKRTYSVQTVPIGCKPVWLCLHLHQLECKDCGARRQEAREIADPRRTFTRQLARLALDLTKVMTIHDVSRFLQMSWHQVRDIVKEKLERQETKRSWRQVKYLAIDEIAIRKGHRYMTVIVDLKSGVVLDAVEGRACEDLEPVFKHLRKARAKLKAIAVDMSPAYKKAIQTYAPGVSIVHDPFHVVQSVNMALDEVRRMEQARLEGDGKKVIKGSRFLLLKGKEKLEKDQEKVRKLDALLAQNENLFRAYLLKEDLRQLWSQPDKAEAEAFLETWIGEARDLNLAPFNRLLKTFSRHREALLAWYDHPISTGPLEGLNNKIKVLKRRAYGYRNQSFFRLLILFIHQTKFRLSGT